MNFEKGTKVELVDDSKEAVGLLITQRLPWLFLGLIGAITASFIVSKFEALLSTNISLAFFLPLVVYMSDAMGTQTQTIFVRNLARPGKERLSEYVFKEFFLGLGIGIMLGFLLAGASYIWLRDLEVATTLLISTIINLSTAPIVALIVSKFLYESHEDPALGSGPMTTIIQDIMSILVYFATAYFIIFA